MGDAFRGSGGFSGRSVSSSGGTKLEAARRALCERVGGLDATQKIVVIGFTSAASVVFEGVASQSAELENALDGLSAGGGTSIAAAFDAASDYVSRQTTRGARVLLVSDCRSDLEAAVASADRLVRSVPIIDVLLIDPEPETENAARALIRLGEVQASHLAGGTSRRRHQPGYRFRANRRRHGASNRGSRRRRRTRTRTESRSRRAVRCYRRWVYGWVLTHNFTESTRAANR
jgi:hypothetical protein